MPSSTVNICVLTLVLLCHLHTSHCRPHSRSKRLIIKDYFNPTYYSPDEFEKGEDGKYYLKKSAHRKDSRVEYVTDVNDKEEKTSDIRDFESVTVETPAKINPSEAQTEGAKTEELLTEAIEAEKHTNTIPELRVDNPSIKESEELNLPEKKIALKENIDKAEIDTEKAPFTPVNPELIDPPKPNSKDEIAVKTTDGIEEEKVEGKIAIGEFPYFYPRIPLPKNFRMPVLIPIRHVSYGTVSVLPIPPTEVSDRLPFGLDIVGEGETESETASSEVAKSIGKAKKDAKYIEYPIGRPLMGLHSSLLSLREFLTDLKDTSKTDVEKKSKVVDVLGKKFLMKSNVMKYPSDGNSHTFVRLTSVQPLEKDDPTVIKKFETEKRTATEEKANDNSKEDFDLKEKEYMAEATEVAKKEEKKNFEEPVIEKEKETFRETESLKAEESEISVKIESPIVEDMTEKVEEYPGEKLKDEMLAYDLKRPEYADEEITEMEKKEEKSMDLVTEETEIKNPEKKVEDVVIDSTSEPKVKGDDEMKNIAENREDIIGEKVKDCDIKDSTMKENLEKEMNTSKKEELLLLEQKKKEMKADDQEKMKKKDDKKKKKCKCEEDSDSEQGKE